MLGYYNYTVYLTYVGLLSGLLGISFAFEGNPFGSIICLLVSGLCDMFDGKIARTKKNRTEDEKKFGIQIDSLCDVICFGVLPAVISLSCGCLNIWQKIISAVFVLCGVIRLAYFNVNEETRQKATSDNRKVYNGLPITSSAVFVPLLFCFRKLLTSVFPIVFSIVLAVLGLLFITPITVKKPGKWSGIVLVFIGAVIFAAILIMK